MKKRGLAGLLALALILALAACGGTEAQEDAAQDQKMEEAAPPQEEETSETDGEDGVPVTIEGPETADDSQQLQEDEPDLGSRPADPAKEPETGSRPADPAEKPVYQPVEAGRSAPRQTGPGAAAESTALHPTGRRYVRGPTPDTAAPGPPGRRRTAIPQRDPAPPGPAGGGRPPGRRRRRSGPGWAPDPGAAGASRRRRRYAPRRRGPFPASEETRAIQRPPPPEYAGAFPVVVPWVSSPFSSGVVFFSIPHLWAGRKRNLRGRVKKAVPAPMGGDRGNAHCVKCVWLKMWSSQKQW